jgi:hypothetical protein
MNKSKSGSTRASIRGSQGRLSPQLLPRSEALSSLTFNNPISSPRDARSWFETKGWILAGEQYTKPKLADILFTVATDAKIPTESKSAIMAVAYLIEDIAEEDFAASISDKIIAKIDDALSNLSADIDNTKKFLAATGTQQAESTLAFQEAVEIFSGNVDKLTLASNKAAESIGEHQKKLSDVDWPALGISNPTSENTNPLNSRPFSLTHIQAKVQQRASLATKQVYITTDQDDNKAPTSRTIEDQRKLRDNLMAWLTEEERTDDPEFNNPCAIRGTKILSNFDVLLEFDSDACANLFKKHADSILPRLCPSARIRPRSYPLIFRFVPCRGDFDPDLNEHIRNIELDNGADPKAITSASWCKRPDMRSPNQQTANLKVYCSSAENANFFLKERIRVLGEIVNVRKDIRMPVRCNQCQEYDHIRANCTNTEKCANCASENHMTGNCTIGNKPHCVSCGEHSDHGSASPSCPTLKRKCEALDLRFPENSLPYYPTSDRSTWVTAPKNPPRPSSPMPQRAPMAPSHSPSSSQRQTDNGWPRQHRQTELTIPSTLCFSATLTTSIQLPN